MLGFRSFPIFLPLVFFFSFVNRLFGTWRIQGLVCFLFSPALLIGLFTLFGTPWAKGGVSARDLARWLVWRSAKGFGHEAGGLRPPC